MITTTTPSVEGRRITAYHGIGLGHGRDGGLTAMQALRLYWWKERVNFGDRLSRDVVQHFAGRPVVWAPPEEAEIFDVGGQMQRVRHASTSVRRGGSGRWSGAREC